MSRTGHHSTKYEDKSYRCPSCHGMGYIESDTYDPVLGHGTTREPCLVCNNRNATECDGIMCRYRHNKEWMGTHWEFYQHLLSDGMLLRNDRLNNAKEMLDRHILTTLHGCACSIYKYGASDLSYFDGGYIIPVDTWKVQVFGERCGKAREISVVHVDNKHGQQSWGWFDNRKLLVSHNGGPCSWPLCGFVWDQQIAIAEEPCRRLNDGLSIT